MRQPQIYTSWLVTCASWESRRALEQWLAPHIDLDRVIVSVAITRPNGVEQVQETPHRLGDYFAAIRMLASESPSSFRLVFHRLAASARFWKDLMVRIIEETVAAPEHPTVTIDYKGDEAPAEPLPSTK